jgi:hypothetical protein
MGLFSRKAPPPAPTASELLDEEYYVSDGGLLLGSGGDDMDAETDVVGESEFRHHLARWISSCADDRERKRGRMDAVFNLDIEGDRIAVILAIDTVGYVEPKAAAEWLPRVRDWRSRDVDIMCSGVVLWNSKLGDPCESDDVPIGVRLDLVEQT